MVRTLPRIVIAAPASGHGKTTIATGLMGALRARGRQVAPFKVGPDYIDPGYHYLATGRPGRNLDPHMVGEHLLLPLLLHGSKDADIAVVEGVMGLFDGSIGGEGFASTAHLAQILGAAVVLVVDISSASRTIAATVLGMAMFDPRVSIAGVILNKAGSQRHAGEVVAAMEHTGIPVLGVLSRDDGISAPSRHLGLVPAAERTEAAGSVDDLASKIAAHIDIDQIIAIAENTAPINCEPWDPAAVVQAPSVARPVVAIAGGRAFTFRYAETEELLRAAGCEPVVFDPLSDSDLPAQSQGLYLGGGFPEVYAASLSANAALRQAISAAVAAGMPTVAECAGLLYLCQSVDSAPMVGAINATAAMHPRLTLSYRTAIAPQETLVAVAGQRITGHEFHRTQVSPATFDGSSAWLLDGQSAGFSADPAGTGRPTMHASYLHTHWAGYPEMAQRFADSVHAYQPTPAATRGRFPNDKAPLTLPTPPQDELAHHGDVELGDGLADFAVNVLRTEPPPWLAEVINAATPTLASYPDAAAATDALASLHGRDRDEVLPTAGAAEGFVLLARSLKINRPVVVHPQFTEPELALRAAGHDVTRVVLTAGDGFRFDRTDVPDDADAIFIGNPTNPTSILHRASDIVGLLRPGRTVVVDEAFMDVVPGEVESLVCRRLPGLIVLRSLTKTWGIAGLRAGYAVGDRQIIAGMSANQPRWSVSSAALAVMRATAISDAEQERHALARTIERNRTVLLDELDAAGIRCVSPARGPFVLADTGSIRPRSADPGWLREQLRGCGYAVRRGDTFPGLGADWIRIAVRSPEQTRALVSQIVAVVAAETSPTGHVR